jgi:predicted cobalt transporter CbtA
MPSASPATDPFGSLARLLAIGLVSGLLASVPYTVAQQVWVEPLLRQAEAFEQRHPESEAGEPLLTGWRGAAVTNGAAGVGFGLLLAAAVSIRRVPPTILSGLLWGLAGFAAFSLWPALTLPVGLPGLASAPLPIRQAWWALAVICAAVGLMLLAWAPKPAGWIAGAAIALLPPLASHLFWEWPETPPDLRALQNRFGVAALVASALFWIAIGTLEGLLASGRRARRTG